MAQTIQLRPKQLEQIGKIQGQKTQLNNLFKEVSEKEQDLLTLILEEHSISGEVSDVKVDEKGVLSFEVKVPDEPKKKKKEVKPE